MVQCAADRSRKLEEWRSTSADPQKSTLMRTAFGPHDEQAFHSTSERLTERFGEWAEARGREADPFVASVAFDYKWGYGDGHLGRWTPADLDALLLSHFPRKISLAKADWPGVIPSMHAFVDFLAAEGLADGGGRASALHAALDGLAEEFPEAMADRSLWGMAKGLFMPGIEAGLDLGDEATLDDYVQRYNTGLTEPEPVPPLPPVLLAPDAELAEAAAASRRLQQIQEFTHWLGEGKSLTQTGRLKLADARELVAKLDTGDVMDPTVGERIFRTTTSEELYHLNLIFEWAKRARLVRVLKGRLVPVKAAVKLLDDPLALWERLWGVFEELGDTMIRGRLFSLFEEEFENGFRAVLMTLMATPVPLGLLQQVAWAVVSEPYVLDGGAHEALLRRSVDADVEHLVAEFTLLGVLGGRPLDAEHVERLAELEEEYGTDIVLELGEHPEVLELTPLGTWAVFHMMRAEGADVRSFDDLAAAGLEEVITETIVLGPEELTAGLTAWLDRRDADSAGAELTRLVRESRDPVLRMGAGEGLILLGESGIAAVRSLAVEADPAVGGFARFWLTQNAEGPADAVSSADAAYQGIDHFAAMLSLVPAPEMVADILPTGQERLLEEFAKSDHPELTSLLEAFGKNHPDKKTAKAARKLLFRVRSRKPSA